MTPKLKRHEAETQVEEERWMCATCIAPAQENSDYCLSCFLYWRDCKDGMWGDDYDV